MTECTARVHDTAPGINLVDWLKAAFSPSRPCGATAAWQSHSGPRCQAHAEQMVDAMLSDRTFIGIYLERQGKRPRSREEAWARLFVPLS
jgi:hypothetical protein